MNDNFLFVDSNILNIEEIIKNLVIFAEKLNDKNNDETSLLNILIEIRRIMITDHKSKNI